MRASLLGRMTLPDWLLAVVIAVSGPLLLFHYGSYHWFALDDSVFITLREGSGYWDLFAPHGGAHWSTVPRVIYRGLWQAFGMTTYRPYQVPVIVSHLAVAILLYAVMRRAGVRPWLGFAAVTLFVLVGPGAVNSVWGFQVGFNGSIAWGLGHLLLADHDGPPDRRDLLGLGCGLLAISSSGVGVTLTVGVAVAVLLRRGWRMALLHSAPLAVIYGIWMLVADATTTSGAADGPPWSMLFGWLRSSAIGTMLSLGRFAIVAWALVAVLVLGMAIAWGPWRGRDLKAVRTQLAMPIGLLVAAAFFPATIFYTRWWTGAMGARSDRYLYLGAALVLPLIAVAAEAIAQQWRRTTPALIALFLIPVPFNLANFDAGVLTEGWMASREYVFTTAVRMPFASDVPRDVRPMSNAIVIDPVTIGFLLDAEKAGDLTPSTIPITPQVTAEFKVRLGVARRVQPEPPPVDCRTYDRPITLEPRQGEVLHLGSGVTVATFDGERPGPTVPFPRSAEGDTQLTVELPDLTLQVGPFGRSPTFKLCRPG